MRIASMLSWWMNHWVSKAPERKSNDIEARGRQSSAGLSLRYAVSAESREAFFQIGEDVVDVLSTDGETDRIGLDTHVEKLFR